jgi:hypothetical protein
MPYAAPVLAEREHVARRAQRASIRRRPTEGTSTGSSARTLGDAVGSHLRARNVDPDTVSWDAWRREDGRWTLTGSYTTAGRVGAAHFSFDGPGNYVVADDDDAHWLLGEVEDAPESSAAESTDDLSARRRRLSAVPAEELPLGEDAIELVNEDAEAAAPRADMTAALGAEAPVEAYLDGDDTPSAPVVPEADTADGTPEVDDDEEHPDEPASRKPVKKTRGRASVPSWDEIMFGGGSGGSQD